MVLHTHSLPTLPESMQRMLAAHNIIKCAVQLSADASVLRERCGACAWVCGAVRGVVRAWNVVL